MNLRFNSNGNLHETAELSFDAFQLHFGTNASRKEKIKNAVTFFKIFGLCGCKAVYVAGSFVSKKKNPEDIDLLFDLTEVDDKKLRTEFPEFFGSNRHNNLGIIRRNLKCHVFTFDEDDLTMFEILQSDRDGYPKGFVKISLENEFNYDQKRKTI
jgi:hypothetical protein